MTLKTENEAMDVWKSKESSSHGDGCVDRCVNSTTISGLKVVAKY